MTSPGLMPTATRLATGVDALAALAAHLRVVGEGLEIDPAVRSLLTEIATEILGDDPASVVPPGPAAGSVVGMAQAFFRQANDLVAHPGRAGGWDDVDEALLQGIGRLSKGIADAIAASCQLCDGLGAALDRSGSVVLDVGTGTAWLAIALAQRNPAIRVVGIDIFEPALALARANIAGVGLADRVEVRRMDAAELPADGRYDGIWLPLPFLPPAIVPSVLDACRGALKPGGWLLPGTFAGPGDRLGDLLMELRTVRSGGRVWTLDDLIPLLAAAGFADPIAVPRSWAAPVHLFAARAPT